MISSFNRKTSRSLLLLLLTVLIGVAPVAAKRTFEPVFNPNIFVSKVSSAIKIDGKLDDREWAGATLAENFVERSPGDMTEPEVETRAYITYDEDHLYVAFVCYDDPASIRATMCQRDQFFGDDAVALLIDTYGDASWAYEFFVNPYGVQRDQLWTSVAGEDHGFDLIWQSAAQITDSGYQVEIAVPFSSMRFPSGESQNWKVDFWRTRPRESFKQYSWAAYDRNEQCWVCQWGTVDGIANVTPGKGMEVLASVVGNQSGSLADRQDPESAFDNEKVDGELSIGGKYSISSNMTLEGTYNPDFSQIESDAAQIDVNTTIALFYPERRPFFQEGADIFRTLFNSFYTRTVNDPRYAAKLVGRSDKYAVGFLTALDENTPYMIPLEESSILLNTGESYVNVLRGSRSIGEDNRIGFILSDRRLDGGGSGSIAAFDHDIRLSRSWRFDGQYILSHTDEPDNLAATEGLNGTTFNNGNQTVAFDGESYFGDAAIARVRHNSRNVSMFLTYDHVSPTYRTQVGYDPVSNGRRMQFYSSYRFRPEQGLFERIQPQVYMERKWNYDGTRKNILTNFNLNSDLRLAQTNVGISYNFGEQTWSGVEFEGLWHVDMYVNSQPTNAIGFNLDVNYGRSVALSALTEGKETSVFAAVDFKPFDRLIIEPNMRYAHSVRADNGEELYSGYITRTRFQLQANKELSVRLVVQYNDFSEKWDIDPLLTYRIGSFSVFYLGSTYDYSNYLTGPNDQTDWRLSSRQFFAKFQYLFQI